MHLIFYLTMKSGMVPKLDEIILEPVTAKCLAVVKVGFARD
jgi:hypothetical protein